MTLNNKLNPKRFRDHYYKKARIPNWDRDFGKLKFGIEIEYIVHSKSSPNILMGRQDYFNLINSMIENGYTRKYDIENVGRISRSSDEGYIKICPDFAYHILEISLPPIQTFDRLQAAYNGILSELDRALDDLGFCRSSFSFLQPNKEFDLVVESRLTGSIESFQSGNHLQEFASPWMASQISSTHVHFNIGVENELKLLPALYETEWISLCLFNDTNEVGGRNIKSIRTLLYEHTFGEDYHLVNIPSDIPTTVDKYVDLFNSSKALFPSDKFCPARDFSVIRPTPYGTLEFRSADTTQSLESLIDLVIFRLLQLKFAMDRQDHEIDHVQLSKRYIEIAKSSVLKFNSKETATLERFLILDTKEIVSMGISQDQIDRVLNRVSSLLDPN